MPPHSGAMTKRTFERRQGAPGPQLGSAFEMTRSLRLSLPKARWRPRERAGALTDALGGALFVLIAGGGWLFIADATDGRAPETAVSAIVP